MKKCILCLLLLAALVFCLSGCKGKTPEPLPDGGEIVTEDGSGGEAASGGNEVNPGTVGYYPNAAPEQPLTPAGAENAGQPADNQQAAALGTSGGTEAPSQPASPEPAAPPEEPEQIVGYEEPSEIEGPAVGSCTVSISCSTILNNMEKCDPAKAALVPATGWILAPTVVSFEEGESVLNVLQRTCQQNGIQMAFSNTNSGAQIESVGNLCASDVGELSGWVYCVNGVFPNYSCSRFILQPGDTIRVIYTCEQGADVGGNNS